MVKRFTNYIEDRRILKNSINKAKKISLPGFEGASIYDVFNFFFKELRNDQITMRAASVAFYFLLALFPAILFLFSLIPYIPVEGFRFTLFESMESVLPHTAFFFLEAAIEDILTVQRRDLLSIGLLFTFYFSTSGVHALMKSFNKVYPIFKKRGFFREQFVAIQLTILIIILLIVSVVLIILGDILVDIIVYELYLHATMGYYLLQFLRWIIIVGMYFTTISFIYYWGPATTKRWRFISAGSMVATVLAIIISLLFSYVINNFDLYNKIYGSIGALIAVCIWIYLNTLVLLIGFELNASINFQKNLRAGA